MWWDDQQIEATVTRQFVCNNLLPEEMQRLDQPLDFGDGLTDGTYWSWVNEKAKRIFLILVDIGIPDQIFNIVDDSWDDSDLPIALDQVERLELTAHRDDRINRRFYYRQFHYLLRYIEPGEHIDYTNEEIVPIDVVEKRVSRGLSIDKVTLPSTPSEVLCRRRIPLGKGFGCLTLDEFNHEINTIKNIQNEHLVSYWASYTHQNAGYVLFTPASDYTLHCFLNNPPAHIKSMEKHKRRHMVFNWIHCLIDTLSYIHSRGLYHGNIKPSTIFLNNDNHIFFSDFTRLNAEYLVNHNEKSGFDKESYDFGAPETCFKPSSGQQHSPTAGRRPAIHKNPLSSSPDTIASHYSYGSSTLARSNSTGSMTLTTAGSPTPVLDPQVADVFSLGCIILELINYLMKKSRNVFAAHRAARHKTAGRGGAVLDSSFHKNLGQVESWMATLNKEAKKKGKDDPVMRGVEPLHNVVIDMLAVAPDGRPSASRIEQRLYEIVTGVCNIAEPHCVHQYGGWDFGIGRLHMSPPAATAVTHSTYRTTQQPLNVPSILRRPNSSHRNVEYQQPKSYRKASSGGKGQHHPAPTPVWRITTSRARPYQSPSAYSTGNPYQDSLAC